MAFLGTKNLVFLKYASLTVFVLTDENEGV